MSSVSKGSCLLVYPSLIILTALNTPTSPSLELPPPQKKHEEKKNNCLRCVITLFVLYLISRRDSSNKVCLTRQVVGAGCLTFSGNKEPRATSWDVKEPQWGRHAPPGSDRYQRPYLEYTCTLCMKGVMALWLWPATLNWEVSKLWVSVAATDGGSVSLGKPLHLHVHSVWPGVSGYLVGHW